MKINNHNNNIKLLLTRVTLTGTTLTRKQLQYWHCWPKTSRKFHIAYIAEWSIVQKILVNIILQSHFMTRLHFSFAFFSQEFKHL